MVPFLWRAPHLSWQEALPHTQVPLFTGGPHDQAWLVSVFCPQQRGSVQEWAHDQSQINEAASRDRTLLLMGAALREGVSRATAGCLSLREESVLE